MHEMSIVESLLDAIRQELRERPAARLETVRVRVGALRQVVPEMLEFCYQAATADTPFAGSRLMLETVPASARCRPCSLEFAVGDRWFECPRCGSTDADLVRGDELLLLSLELTEPQPVEAVG